MVRRTPQSRWPDGTGSYRIREVGGRSGEAARTSALLLESVVGATHPRLTVHTVPESDARDIVDAGADLVVTEDPSLASYAASRPGVSLVPLSWDRTWAAGVADAQRSGAADSVSAETTSARTSAFRSALARDAVRADARPSHVGAPVCSGAVCQPRSARTATTKRADRLAHRLSARRARRPRTGGAARGVGRDRARRQRSGARRSRAGPGRSCAPRPRGSHPTTSMPRFVAGTSSRSSSPFPYTRPHHVGRSNRCSRRRRGSGVTRQAGTSVVRSSPLIDTRPRAIARQDRISLTFAWDSTLIVWPCATLGGRTSMSFRSRLLIAFVLATVIPLAVLAIRRAATADDSARRTASSGACKGWHESPRRTSSGRARRSPARLASLVRALRTDDRFRLAAIRGDEGERGYMLDWAEQAMRTTGLSMLQLQDDQGRIVSSGHFRNEFDRLEPDLARALAATKSAVLVRARAPDGPFLALARVDSVFLADRRFDLVGGVRVDSAFLERFAREEGLTVSLDNAGRCHSERRRRRARVEESPSSRQRARPLDREDGDSSTPPPPAAPLGMTRVVRQRRRRARDSVHGDGRRAASPAARLVIAYTIPELAALRRDVDRWFIARHGRSSWSARSRWRPWLSARLSRPLATLTHAASTIDLEGPELAIAAQRDDEIGTLARRLGGLSTRLRASAARLRQAERRATVGDMARQVNHDIKNGLIPIRNVLRHLVQVQEQQPHDLASVFRGAPIDTRVERQLPRHTRPQLRAPDAQRRAAGRGCERDRGRGCAITASCRATSKVRTRLADELPRAFGDAGHRAAHSRQPRRNAVESLDGARRRRDDRHVARAERRDPDRRRGHRPRDERGGARARIRRFLHDEG